MNDERFDHDLRRVLREAAGEEAPMSLRSRLASITDEAPVSRRLWFFQPMRLSVAVVSVVAVLVLAFLLMQRDTVGPGPSQSPEPTPTAEKSGTPAPSAEPTSPPSAWTGLAWNGLAVPNDAQSFSYISDIVASDRGLVAVGNVHHDTGSDDLAFFWTDGSEWTITQLIPDVAAVNSSSLIERLMRTSDGYLVLVAAQGGDSTSVPRLWSSPDGTVWTEIHPTGWTSAWTNGRFVGVATGARGTVVVGEDTSTSQALVLASVDNEWTLAQLPVGETVAVARDVAALPDGFVIVGREGQPDTTSAETGLVTPGVGKPAAWTSPDGIAWTSVPVDGNVTAGAEIRRVLVGADGLLATGVNTETGPSTFGELSSIGESAWTSRDGSTWQLFDELWGQVADVRLIASDGSRMVIFGVDDSTADEFNQADSAAWVSTDGRTWTRLDDANGDAPRFYTRETSSECAGCPAPIDLWVVDDGILLSIGAGAPVQGMLIGWAL